MESKGRLIVIAVAGVIVAFGAIAVYNRVVGSNEAPLVEKTEANNLVLVARRDLAPGMFVQVPQDVDWQQADPAMIKEEHVREGTVQLSSFSGAVVRRQLRAGDLISNTALMTSGEGGFMSAVLEQGMRAVSVAVNATSGNAGFISPGDRVDLIVTRKIRASANSGDQIVSQTFVNDVRVLAVDQMLDNPENKAILAKTVTVEVTPAQAEQVAVATEMGKISLALRSVTSGQKAAAAEPSATAPAPAAELDTVVSEPVDETKPVELYESQDAALPNGEMNLNRPLARSIRVIRGDQIENVDLR